MSAYEDLTFFYVDAIVNFLSSEPIIYVFGFIFFIFIIKTVKELLPKGDF